MDFFAPTLARRTRSRERRHEWQSGTKNPDVIDARGGQIKTPIGTFTLDRNGVISSFTPR